MASRRCGWLKRCWKQYQAIIVLAVFTIVAFLQGAAAHYLLQSDFWTQVGLNLFGSLAEVIVILLVLNEKFGLVLKGTPEGRQPEDKYGNDSES